MFDLQSKALAAATKDRASTAPSQSTVARIPVSKRVEVAAVVLQGIVANRSSSVASRNKGEDVGQALAYADQLLIAAMQGLEDVASEAALKAMGVPGTDGSSFNSGRLEGQADVAAQLRAILDPADTNHWSLEGLLNAVKQLKERVK